MKKSKLDPHREFIAQKLKSPTSIAQLRRDLASIGCSVSRSHLTDWIEESGIKYTKRKAGRPKKAKRQIFPLLPVFEDEQMNVVAPIFLFGLQVGVAKEMSIGMRKQYLDLQGLPSSGSSPANWKDLDRYAKLSDVELMLLAFLRSELDSPPLSQGADMLHKWFSELQETAAKLRAEIVAACERQKS